MSSKTIFIAQSSAGRGVAPLRLVATEPFPEIAVSGEAGLAAARGLHADQGKTIVDALYASLPGGTLDAVLCEMLQRRASLLRVPFEGRVEPKECAVPTPQEPTSSICALFSGMDGELFKRQRLCLDRIADDESYRPTKEDMELLEGLRNFTDTVADIAHDEFHKKTIFEGFINYYRCTCGHEWQDEWDCQCDDRCPKCNTSVSPCRSEDA
ncbi:hypothetical protein FY034_17840 (plasmid) [Trichlorobacter lovleyi]|uniref:hypothetical protein n=1 Tax=Trichlorobacter lovleyi TaxID=313985 RepID=UPI00223F7FBC|nr:hypothetical protein [Trichlorobacter lovleyi]QOX80884.1 hypothetical protein FY034_17840 [Trichlorobacter lovleyi]